MTNFSLLKSCNPIEAATADENGRFSYTGKLELTTEIPVYTEQQIGKETINVPTTRKDVAQNRLQRDEQKLQQVIEGRLDK